MSRLAVPSNDSQMAEAICRISRGSEAGTERTQRTASSSVIAVACARSMPRIRGWRA